MKDLILIGKQGSGKGTQGKILAEKFGFKIFETGAALRSLSASGSVLGNEIKEVINRGDLVSNELVMKIVADFLEHVDASTPVIFDGIPRSEIQRESLELELEKAGRSWKALHITLSDDEAYKRLLSRGTANDTGAKFGVESKAPVRADDNKAGIEKRLANFAEHTAPIVEIWREKDKLIEISGEQAPDKVTKDILAAIV